MKCLFKPVKNPHKKDNLRNRYDYWTCRAFGHTWIGPYYGMPLASCWVCGKKHPYNSYKDAPGWSKL